MLSHACPICFAFGNGFSSGYLFRYILSISAVCCFSLYVPESCILHPCMLMIPCCASMLVLLTVANSCASAPISISS